MWYHIGGIFKKGTNELIYKTEIESWVQKTNYDYQEMGWGDKLRDWDWNILTQFNSVQSLSHVWLSATPWITARQASLSITNSWSLLKLSPSSRWCHPAISSSVVPFSSCPQSLPASGSFSMSQLFARGGQSTGVSASASVLPVNTQNHLYSTGLLLLSRFSRVRLCAAPKMVAHQTPRPWESPGKNTGVGWHFLLQWMKVKSESEVAQSRPTLSDPMNCSPPGSSIHGIF